MSNAKIALLIPYFGSWPQYFMIFLSTVAKQKIIDVYLITDLEVDGFKLPQNVYIKSCGLDNLSRVINKAIGIDINIIQPRKLCDLKPAYGLIFQELVSSYEFWAFGDIDLFFGKADEAIDKLLPDYDIISFREEWLSGSLCIFRNNEKNRNLFQLSRRWEEYFLSSQHIAFDETCGIYEAIAGKGADALLKYEDTQSFSQIVRQEELRSNIRVYRKKTIAESIAKGCFIRYLNGEITDCLGTKFIYYHYITEKRNAGFKYPEWRVLPEKFFVDRYGFYAAETPRSFPTEAEFVTWHFLNVKALIQYKLTRFQEKIF